MTLKEIGILILIIVLMLSLLGGFALFFFRYKRSVEEDCKKGEYDLDLLKSFKKETNPKVKKKKSAFRILRRVLSISLIVIISAFLVFGICDKLGLLKVGSKSIIVVASGSMSFKHPDNDYLEKNNLNDQFPTHSIIVVEKVDPNDLKLYDTVVYKNNHGTNIIHRIIKINYDKNTNEITSFVTKGDALSGGRYFGGYENQDDYRPVPADIQGRYTGDYVPVLGAIVLFIQSSLGIATMIALIIGLILVDNTKNKVVAIHNNRLNLLLEKLSLNEENIQSLSEEDFINMIQNSDLKKTSEDEEKSEESNENVTSETQPETEVNQNDENDNTN